MQPVFCIQTGSLEEGLDCVELYILEVFCLPSRPKGQVTESLDSSGLLFSLSAKAAFVSPTRFNCEDR